MSDNNLLQIDPQRRGQPQGDMIDLKKIFFLVIKKWYYFVIAMIVAMLCAFFYNSYTVPTYRISATFLINERKKGGLMKNNQPIQDLSIGEVIQNLDNQIMILKSRTLIGKTLDELPFDIEIYRSGLFNKTVLYPNPPIKIIPENIDSLPRDITFTFKLLNNSKFSIDGTSKNNFALHTQSSFGELIQTPGGNFHINLSYDKESSKNLYNKINFKFHSREKLVASYLKRLKIEKASRTGTAVIISLEGTNKTMDIEFLNKMTGIFLNNSLDKKNQEAIRTIQFIDDQLIGISDSLDITENKLQQFRSRNRVMNVSAQGKVIIDQSMSLDNEKGRLETEASYYSYLAEYLAKDNVGQAPIAPATMGITDPGLTKLVADLAELQGQLFSKRLGEKNPLQSQMAQRVSNTKEALKETLKGVRSANNLALSEIMQQIRNVNAQASALPVTERQLLGIERKYKLNDELYTFLLEKRADAQIQKASNMPDNELIDSSTATDKPVKPKKLLTFVLALIAGSGFPFLWILIADTFNDKVRKNEDIKQITNLPVIGHIPHSLLKKNTVVLNEPASREAEAFRSLRYRIQFFTKEVKTPVILITSSMQDEGKTFTAINLASVYSFIGKKTVLIGFDMRKPKIFNDFGFDNDHGVSTWLIGKDGLQDIIKETSYENLSVISAGPIPPNPSELIALEKTKELLRLLKERYECIIIDSSPIGIISDTFHLTSLADTSILVVRKNVTLKDLLANTLKELKDSEVKSLSLVINDIGIDDRTYGYGESYGAAKQKVKSKK